MENLLISSTDISFSGLWELVRTYDGVMFPAHIDKASNSLIYNLGFIPEDSLFRTAEIADMKQYHALKKEQSLSGALQDYQRFGRPLSGGHS